MNATATAPQAEPTIEPGRNKYPGWCWRCSKRLQANQGWLDGRDEKTNRWRIACDPCNEAESARIEVECERTRAEWEAKLQAERERRRAEAEARDRQRAEQERQRWEWAEESRRRLRDLDAMIFAMQAAEIFRPRIPACLVTLGLEPPVTGAQVKAAYRRLAMRHHPDKGGDPAEFTRIQAAYSEAMQLAGVAP